MVVAFLDCASDHTDIAAHKADASWRSLDNRRIVREMILADPNPVMAAFRDAERRHCGLATDVTVEQEPAHV